MSHYTYPSRTIEKSFSKVANSPSFYITLYSTLIWRSLFFGRDESMYYRKEGKMYFQKEVMIGKLEKGYMIILRTKNNPEFPDEDVYVTLDEVLKRVKQFLEE